jgi:hypothetical protein
MTTPTWKLLAQLDHIHELQAQLKSPTDSKDSDETFSIEDSSPTTSIDNPTPSQN